MAEFRVGGWAIGVMRDLGKRPDQCILCKVVQVTAQAAIVETVAGQSIDTGNSPRAWFAPIERDEGCERIWATKKTQWRNYRNMLGVLGLAQKKATIDPNKVWEPIDDNFLPVEALRPRPATVAPQDAAKPVSDAPSQAAIDLDSEFRVRNVVENKQAWLDSGMTEEEFTAKVEAIKYAILMGG